LIGLLRRRRGSVVAERAKKPASAGESLPGRFFSSALRVNRTAGAFVDPSINEVSIGGRGHRRARRNSSKRKARRLQFYEFNADSLTALIVTLQIARRNIAMCYYIIVVTE